MEKIKISVCVRPYYHDVIDNIERKPKYDSKTDTHYVSYKSKRCQLDKRSEGYYIWVNEE